MRKRDLSVAGLLPSRYTLCATSAGPPSAEVHEIDALAGGVCAPENASSASRTVATCALPSGANASAVLAAWPEHGLVLVSGAPRELFLCNATGSTVATPLDAASLPVGLPEDVVLRAQVALQLELAVPAAAGLEEASLVLVQLSPVGGDGLEGSARRAREQIRDESVRPGPFLKDSHLEPLLLSEDKALEDTTSAVPMSYREGATPT